MPVGGIPEMELPSQITSGLKTSDLEYAFICLSVH